MQVFLNLCIGRTCTLHIYTVDGKNPARTTLVFTLLSKPFGAYGAGFSHQPNLSPQGYKYKIYIYISPRSGGKYMKKSAAYPVGFGKALLRKHQTFLEAWGYVKGS